MNTNNAASLIAPHPVWALLDSLRKDTFFLILAAGLIVLGISKPGKIPSYPALVDWPTIAALTGLLLLTKGLETSGLMLRLGKKMVGLMATERATAVFLVLTAALLSTLLTNDVALFVVVPLTLGVCRITAIPATRLIIFEALAVNAGSALTPIGNPQNLFLWQLSKTPFSEFVWHMLPLVTILMLVLLALTVYVFTSRPVLVNGSDEKAALDPVLLGVSLILYVPFLVAADMHQTGWALGVVLLVFLLLRPRVLLQLDWGLLLVFVLMFIDLRLLADLSFIRDGMHGLGLELPKHLYLASIATSQIVSNVPAAIALAEYSDNWKIISYGVSVGGFGFMVGSLANLIALRMSGDRRAWIVFHAYAVPFLLIATLIGYLLLFVRN